MDLKMWNIILASLFTRSGSLGSTFMKTCGNNDYSTTPWSLVGNCVRRQLIYDLRDYWQSAGKCVQGTTGMYYSLYQLLIVLFVVLGRFGPSRDGCCSLWQIDSGLPVTVVARCDRSTWAFPWWLLLVLTDRLGPSRDDCCSLWRIDAMFSHRADTRRQEI